MTRRSKHRSSSHFLAGAYQGKTQQRSGPLASSWRKHVEWSCQDVNHHNDVLQLKDTTGWAILPHDHVLVANIVEVRKLTHMLSVALCKKESEASQLFAQCLQIVHVGHCPQSTTPEQRCIGRNLQFLSTTQKQHLLRPVDHRS